jgi:tetrahydromethanopterin:alpha-L-glutamate ligase
VKKIAVVGVPGGWSSERLADKLHELTQFRLLVDMARVRLDLDTGRAWFEDHDLSQLDGMIVKKVGPAYSPGLLDRLEILEFLFQNGVRIFSRPLNIARMLDRLSCTLMLAKGGIPLPPTVVTEDVQEAQSAVERFGRSVLKPLYTSKARGMAVVEPGPALREELANYKASGNDVIYIQQMMNLPGRDLGVVFLGGKYLATYARVGQKGAWNTTTASGGRYQSDEPSPDIIELAERAQSLFGLDFTCVDVAESDQGPVVFEVSAFGGFRGLQEGCGIDAAELYAQYVLKELG